MEVVYPGTFDPITKGHIDILERALNVFDSVTVLISNNPTKDTLFDVEERREMAEESVRYLKNVHVKSYKGLIVNYIRKNNVKTVIRGLRAVSDFEYEFQMAMTNRRLYEEFDVMFFITDMKYIYLSSSIVKEIGKFNGDISRMVPENVAAKIREKFNNV
ncbi:MAG: pantetheine-phosphate adenylyltransferase [candidate division WOR-3 bacterium]|nr:pantetheine-phosphate adenylyltransferase [candidate division WOR-3 bacterium]